MNNNKISINWVLSDPGTDRRTPSSPWSTVMCELIDIVKGWSVIW